MKHEFRVSEVNDQIVAVAMVDLCEMPEPHFPKPKPLMPVDSYQVFFWCCVAFGVFGGLLTWATWR